MERDVVLLTIDCWRHDAIERMSNLRASTGQFRTSQAITAAPATRGAFPAILNGTYYPRAYEDYDTLRDGGLPELLGDRGYATGAVIGSNPFLSAWAEYFDHLWNDRMDSDGPESWFRDTVSRSISHSRHVSNYLRLRSRVPADEVARRARAWYTAREPPRFLWMHLMDIHIPFFPGLKRAFEVGLLDTYRSHLQFLRDPEQVSDAGFETLESLYWQSVAHLDEQLDRVLAFLEDDAFVVVLGDHGEEFDHGMYGHARLYDECIRVPLLMSETLASACGGVARPMRQLDVAPTVLDALGVPVPDEWDGRPVDADVDADTGSDATEPRPTFALNHSPMLERSYAAIRTDRYKVIKTFDEAVAECLETEAYDLVADEGERTDIYGRDGPVSELERELERFLDRDEIRSGIPEHPPAETSAAVEDRLRALGYRQ